MRPPDVRLKPDATPGGAESAALLPSSEFTNGFAARDRRVSVHFHAGRRARRDWLAGFDCLGHLTIVRALARQRLTDGQDWLLTLAPPPRTSAAGLKDGMLAVGQKVTAHGHRSRDNNKYEVKTERLTVDSKSYNVYPDRT